MVCHPQASPAGFRRGNVRTMNTKLVHRTLGATVAEYTHLTTPQGSNLGCAPQAVINPMPAAAGG